MTRRTILTNLILVILCTAITAVAQQPTSYQLQSPNGRIQVTIKTGERLTYDVRVNDQPVLVDSSLSIDIDRKVLGANPKVKSAKRSSTDRGVILVPVPQKSDTILENYKELK